MLNSTINKRLEKWIDALRGEDYTQGRFALRCIYADGSVNSCPWGIACDLYLDENDDYEWEDTGSVQSAIYFQPVGNVEIYDRSYLIPPRKVIEFFGFTRSNYMEIAQMNDMLFKTFDEIADYIENNILRNSQ